MNQHDYCVEVGYESTIVQLKEATSGSNDAGATLQITSTIQQGGAASASALSASCWLALVRNPVLVAGYPVSQRHNKEAGLEISLDLLITLAKTVEATVFGSLNVLKGFCSMLVATRQYEDSACWHYVLNGDHKAVSYAQALGLATGDTKAVFDGVQKLRHLVGWSVSAETMIGMIHPFVIAT